MTNEAAAKTEPVHPLVLIDGSSWLFRAFHALPPLSNSRGEPTGAVYGMGNMLKRLQREYAPQRICVVFDPKGPTFRNELYEQYKANRTETPPELSAQYADVLALIAGLGLPMITVDGVEADDVIGTLAVAGRAQGLDVLLVTSDKDMAQLVDERTHMLDTMKNLRIDREGVIAKFGVPPERIIDYLALVGDTSDNIPGVDGCGPKTAAKWIAEYGSVEEIIRRADEVKGKIGEKLRASLPVLPLAYQLATIRCDVPLPLTIDALVPGPRDDAALIALYRKLEFHRWREELEVGAPATPEQTDSAAAETSAPVAVAASTGIADLVEPSAPTQVETVMDAEALDRLVAALESADLICFDTETDDLDANQAGLVGLAFATECGTGWYVPLAHNYLGAPDQLPMAEVIARVKPFLEDPARPKVAQHGKYDINVLVRHGIDVAGLAYDTMLESYVLDAAGNRHDMDTLAEKYLNHRTIHFEDVAGKGKNQITFNQVSIDKAAPYSAEDADITLRLHRTLFPRVQEVGSLLTVFEHIEMPLVPVLARIERRGVFVDVPLLKRISVELAGRMDELQKQAHALAEGEFNLGSPKQLQVLLYDKFKLPVLAKTPKGDPSTAEDTLEELALQHPLPRLILDWRAMQKLRSTYADQLPAAVNPLTHRIHTSYHQAVAATGRLSSSDPNLQNIPVRTAEGRRIRQAFVAEPGNALLSVDYSQIELRLMAHFSEDERLQQAFRSGLDVHQATAAEVFGLALEEVGPDQRRAAKAINFGLIYGMSAFGLARQLAIGRSEAAEYIERFFGRYPGVKRFMDGTREAARSRGYVETLFGRRLYLPNINARNLGLRQYAERTAINAPLQGTAADLIKTTMIDLQHWLDAHAPSVQMIMQVHDELVFEGPDAAIREFAPQIADRMCRAAEIAVPLVADYGIAGNWDQAHQASGHASSESPALNAA
ncbi:MAG: polymerase [Hydrocarboniphaga sp.]|uniref:DNA polymerase I n=1 Tax=Hydrocarboniphaga sp. TaxID=2033016 RepID=UPI00260E8E9A|nr:DNA polymerase I [Hydrocarboniphaga sp.]MDB5968245.1 polymerase [Hydrocarboniphaga sp.]